MHPLKSNSAVELSFSFGFAVRFAFTSLSFLRAENWLSPKMIVLLVCMPTIPNRVPVAIIRKYVGEMEVQWIARSPEVRKAAGELSDMVCAETHLSFMQSSIRPQSVLRTTGIRAHNLLD